MVVAWLPDAENDLKGILFFYRRTAGEKIATKITDRIQGYADALGRMPYSGHIELILEDMPGQHRSVVVKRLHTIVYRIVDDVVYVIAVFNCRQDPARLRETVLRGLN
jgi:plasmid stabilization system protein ParE